MVNATTCKVVLIGLCFLGVRATDNLHPPHQRKMDSPTDAFTIIFLSDLECRFRNHSPARCRYVLEFIRDLAQHDLYFDGDYADTKIDPKLIIHGGDNNHLLGCQNLPFWMCRSVQEEWDDVWKAPFETDLPVPLITNYGNHDWYQATWGTGDTDMYGHPGGLRLPKTDIVNSRAQDLVTKTFEEAAAFGVELREFTPTGDIGPSMYRATFRGIQIANFNVAVNWESYDGHGVYSSDAPFGALSGSLDRSMTTLFVQHYPLSLGYLPSGTERKIVDLIQEFPHATLLTGHEHRPLTQSYTTSEPDRYSFNEWVAPYPHYDFYSQNWTPGFYALLVSPTEGILQVKQLDLPGLEDGEPCDISDSCKLCHSGTKFDHSTHEYRCGHLDGGEMCHSDCDHCLYYNDQGQIYECPWWGLFIFFCKCAEQ